MARKRNAGAVAALMAVTASVAAACGGSSSTSGSASANQAASTGSGDCPNGGTVRMGVEPYEDQAKLASLYQPLTADLSRKLGCNVQLTITSNYTSEVYAMQNKKLEFGEFGPLGYVFAHKIAGADAVSTFGDDKGPSTYTASVVTWPGSGVTSLKQCAGKSFGYSDPASTSGHLFPAYALKQAGIDPDKGVQPSYAGSHTASYEALVNHKVTCGELNSETVATASAAGQYKPDMFVTLWTSAPIPDDPLTVRSDLPAAFKAKVTSALDSVDFNRDLGPTVAKGLNTAIGGTKFVPATNGMYTPVSNLVSSLNINIGSLNS